MRDLFESLYRRAGDGKSGTGHRSPRRHPRIRSRCALLREEEHEEAPSRVRTDARRCPRRPLQRGGDLGARPLRPRHYRHMVAVRDLDRLGVQLVSVREAWLDTTGPTRTLLVAIFSWVAEQEREQRSARTKAGLARVRRVGSKSGKPIGRPPRLDAAAVARVRALRAEGRSTRSIAMALHVPRGTVRRALAAAPDPRAPKYPSAPALEKP